MCGIPYFISPGLSWNAMLKRTEIESELILLILDINMYLLKKE